MYWLYEFISEYSVVIILLTVVIRLILMPLDLKQRKNSRKMTAISGELQDLKKRYANNPQQLNQKTKELYNKRGVKPMAGCLPMLLQMIFLFAFFGALRVLASDQTIALILNMASEGVENVQLPQWLWVHNFWQPDSGMAGIFPTTTEFMSFLNVNIEHISTETLGLLRDNNLITFANNTLSINSDFYNNLANNMISVNGLEGVNNGWFGLPVLAGVTLFFSQRFATKHADPTTAQNTKMMLWMFPIISVVVCVTSNAAFAVYWVAANIYMLVQNLIFEWVFKRKERKNQEKIIRTN